MIGRILNGITAYKYEAGEAEPRSVIFVGLLSCPARGSMVSFEIAYHKVQHFFFDFFLR